MTLGTKTSIPMSCISLVGIVFCMFTASCSKPNEALPVDEAFAIGEQLMLEARWDEARHYLREFLLDFPDHPGGHFYLGRSYLLWKEDFRPIIAEGELQMALQLFYENDRESLVPRFPASYFVIICNIESAKACLLQFTIRQESGADRERLIPLVLRARSYLEAARAEEPESQDVKVFDSLVRNAEEIVKMPK